MSRSAGFDPRFTFVETAPDRSRSCDDRGANYGKVGGDSRRLPPCGFDNRHREVHSQKCPLCKAAGPVDVHRSHVAWSIFLVPVWSTMTQVCCRSCGIKLRLGAIAFSVVFGLWGIPFWWVVPALLQSRVGGSVSVELWGVIFGALITPLGLICTLNRINFAVQVARDLGGITVGPCSRVSSVAPEEVVRFRGVAPVCSPARRTPRLPGGPSAAPFEAPTIGHLRD